LVTENRYCSKCLSKTTHNIIKQKDVMMRKGKSLYKCNKCSKSSWKRHL